MKGPKLSKGCPITGNIWFRWRKTKYSCESFQILFGLGFAKYLFLYQIEDKISISITFNHIYSDRLVVKKSNIWSGFKGSNPRYFALTFLEQCLKQTSKSHMFYWRRNFVREVIWKFSITFSKVCEACLCAAWWTITKTLDDCILL